MGVKGLYTYLKPYRREIYPHLQKAGADTVDHEQPLRIGVDAMSMLYKFKAQYKEMYPLLLALKGQGHRLLFVFDGKPPAEKEEEVAARREARQEAAAQAAVIKEHLAAGSSAATDKERRILEFSAARLEHQGWHVTREIRHDFQRALWDMEIPYVKAMGEADDVLTDLVGAEKIDVIISTDMDFLLSAVPRLWIPFRKLADGFEEVTLWDVLDGEGLSPAALRDAGILCGVESLRGQVSFPVQKAFGWMCFYQSIEALLASTAVREAGLAALREEGRLEAARERFRPMQPWTGRIRPDHFERARTFLETL
jgi:5'-3' exonuclease